MKNSKAILAGLLATLLLVLAGCSGQQDLTWAADNQGDKMAPGVYIMCQVEAYNQAARLVEDPEGDVLKQTVEGKNAADWITERTKQEVAKFYVMKQQALTMTVPLTGEQKGLVESWVNFQTTYQSDTLTRNGISVDSLRTYYTNYYETQNVFLAYFGKGGKEAVPQEEIDKAFTENYISARYVLMPKYNEETGEPLDEAGLATAKAKLETYRQKALEAGVNFDDIILEYEKSVAPEGSTVHEHPEGESLHGVLIAKDDPDYPEEFRNAVSNAQVGVPTIGETEDEYVLFLRGDVMEKPENLTEDIRLDLLHRLRDDVFEQHIAEWTQTMAPNVVYNDAFLRKQTPDKLKFN